MPEISVIVPVYKAEKYIERCVTSILNQTFKDFEVLLIDDGSPDCSGAMCDKYAIEDQRIKVIHKKNTGVADTRNVGLREAQGNYIIFIDSDDYVKNNMFERLFNVADKTKSDIVMCQYFIDEEGIIKPAVMKYEKLYDNEEDVKARLLQRYYTNDHNGLYSLWNKIIRRELYVSNNIVFDTNLKRGEDAWFIFQCLKNANRVAYIPEGFYFYYQNQSSIMHTFQEEQYEKWVKTRKKLLEENANLNFKIDYNEFYYSFLYNVAIYCRQLMQRNEIEKVRSILKDEFYHGVAIYRKRLPVHIRILCMLVRKKFINLAILGYKVWSL